MVVDNSWEKIHPSLAYFLQGCTLLQIVLYHWGCYALLVCLHQGTCTSTFVPVKGTCKLHSVCTRICSGDFWFKPHLDNQYRMYQNIVLQNIILYYIILYYITVKEYIHEITQSSKGTDKLSCFCLVHLTFAFLPKAVMHLALTAVQARLEARSHDSQKLGKGAPAGVEGTSRDLAAAGAVKTYCTASCSNLLMV